jgi:hypothetical protein
MRRTREFDRWLGRFVRPALAGLLRPWKKPKRLDRSFSA